MFWRARDSISKVTRGPGIKWQTQFQAGHSSFLDAWEKVSALQSFHHWVWTSGSGGCPEAIDQSLCPPPQQYPESHYFQGGKASKSCSFSLPCHIHRSRGRNWWSTSIAREKLQPPEWEQSASQEDRLGTQRLHTLALQSLRERAWALNKTFTGKITNGTTLGMVCVCACVLLWLSP